ncbi:unnamed protein product, partial [Rangifer tarandus platyrhynchus]
PQITHEKTEMQRVQWVTKRHPASVSCAKSSFTSVTLVPSQVSNSGIYSCSIS